MSVPSGTPRRAGRRLSFAQRQLRRLEKRPR